MNKRRPLIVAVLIPMLAGSTGFIHILSEPRFQNIPAVLIVQLTGSGMCFGVALCALFLLLRTKRES